MSAHARRRAGAARGPDAPHGPRDRAGRRRRAPGAAELLAGRSSRCTSCSRSSCASTRSPAYVVHFTQASALSTAQSLLSAKLCTREERDAIAEAIGAFRFTRGLRQDALQARARGDRRPPRGDAAALPAARRAARADRAAEGDLRHRHARRRHQRPDPHGRLHRAGEVRRHQPPAAEGARVPPDRGPRGPRRVRHARATWSCRRPSTRSRTRAAWPRRPTTRRRPSACRRSRRPRAS